MDGSVSASAIEVFRPASTFTWQGDRTITASVSAFLTIGIHVVKSKAFRLSGFFQSITPSVWRGFDVG